MGLCNGLNQLRRSQGSGLRMQGSIIIFGNFRVKLYAPKIEAGGE